MDTNYNNGNEIVVKPSILLPVIFAALDIVILYLTFFTDVEMTKSLAIKMVIAQLVLIYIIIDFVFLRVIKLTSKGIRKGDKYYNFEDLEKIKYAGNGHLIIYAKDGTSVMADTYDINIETLCRMAGNKGVKVDDEVYGRIHSFTK